CVEEARRLDLPPERLHELRNDVIATLAVNDLDIDQAWDGFPPGSVALSFSADLADLARKAIEIAQPAMLANFQQLLASTPDPMRLAYLLGSMLSLDVQKEQALLEAGTRHEALQLLHGYLSHEVQVLELRQKIASQAQTEISK